MYGTIYMCLHKKKRKKKKKKEMKEEREMAIDNGRQIMDLERK